MEVHPKIQFFQDQNMAVMAKHRLWKNAECGRDGKVQNVVEMGKHRLWESAEYGCDGKVQNMGCSWKAQKLLKFTSFKTIICTVQIESFQDHYKMGTF